MISRIKVPLYPAQLEMVRSAVEAGQLAHGPHLEALAENLCKKFKKRFAVLTANGFSALFACLKALGKANDKVLTPPVGTCFALVNAIRAAGLTPRFVDVGRQTASIEDPESLDCPVALIPDHFGIIAPACKMRSATNHFIIEDAAQAFLSRMQVPTVADAIVLSFYPTKILNGVDGGAILTDNETLYEDARRLTYYDDQTEYSGEHRLNFKLANLHAAFALGTLEHLPEIRSRLMQIYSAYSTALSDKGIPHLATAADETPWRVVLLAHNPQMKMHFAAKFRGSGIETFDELMAVCPPQELERYPTSAALIRESLSIPFYASLSDAEVSAVTSAISNL